MLSIIRKAGLSNSVKGSWAFCVCAGDTAFISRDQGWAISLLIQQKPGILFVCPDVFLFGFLHCLIEIKSWISVLWMGRAGEWQFGKAEETHGLAQNHSQMDLVTEDVLHHMAHHSQYLGQFLLYKLLKTSLGRVEF